MVFQDLRPIKLAFSQLADLESFILSPNSYNDVKDTVLKIGEKPNLKILVLGENCGAYTMLFKITNCPSLEKVLIKKKSWGFRLANANQVMQMKIGNCQSLKKLIIEEETFKSYSKFTLSGLPRLQHLIIGTMNKAKKSNNFLNVSYFELSNLPSLQFVLLGTYSFVHTRHVLFSRLFK